MVLIVKLSFLYRFGRRFKIDRIFEKINGTLEAFYEIYDT